VATTQDAPTGFAIAGGDPNGAFAIDASGQITVADPSALDFETTPTFTLTVQATDGTGTDTASVTVSLSDANEAPAITSGATASVAETATAVLTVQATDPDSGQTLAYALSGGADAGAFAIDPATGALSFLAAPDFEAPADADGDNVYQVQVTVTDDGPGTLTATQSLTVTVTDANEAPSLDAPATARVAETSTAVATVTATDPDAGDSVELAITGGADAAAFQLDPATGALSFAAAPDFEAPADADGDNVYQVQVTATDAAGLSATQSLAVTVTNLNEAPQVAANIPDQTATAEQAFSFQVPDGSFADPDAGDTLSLSAALAGGGALPAWLSFDPATGSFSGTPGEADTGTVSVRVTATDGGGESVGNSFDIQVQEAEEDATPTTVTTESRGPVQFVTVETGAGTVQVASSQVVSGQALQAIAGTAERGNSPLARSFQDAAARAADNPSQTLETALGDPGTRQALLDLDLLGGEALIYVDGEWQPIDLDALLGSGGPQASAGAADAPALAEAQPATPQLAGAPAGAPADAAAPEPDDGAEQPRGLAAARGLERDLWVELAIAALSEQLPDELPLPAPEAAPGAGFAAQLAARADRFDRDAQLLAAALADRGAA
jgi:VCBS repeat-containing protein